MSSSVKYKAVMCYWIWAVWVMGWAVGYMVGGPWDYTVISWEWSLICPQARQWWRLTNRLNRPWQIQIVTFSIDILGWLTSQDWQFVTCSSGIQTGATSPWYSSRDLRSQHQQGPIGPYSSLALLRASIHSSRSSIDLRKHYFDCWAERPWE